MSRNLEPIEDLKEVIDNAKRFHKILKKQSDSYTKNNFSFFYHWYYFPNEGIFAPSKFIGYKNTSLENYIGHVRSGTTTQGVLKKKDWFVQISRKDKNYEHLKNKLEDFAAGLGKKINKQTFNGGGGIYILKNHHHIDENTRKSKTTSLIREAKEGKKRIALHKRMERERKSGLNKAAKEQAENLDCICCGLNFEKRYGDLGKGFIEAHHTLPISQYEEKGKTITSMEDIALVCSNCHRMIHRIIRRDGTFPTKQDLTKIWIASPAIHADSK